MDTTTWLTVAQRLQALAQAGLEYSKGSPFDLERYTEIRALSVQMVAGLTEEPLEKVTAFFTSETGYQTPKVDVRVVVFRGENEVLMVQEKMDHNRWTLPGGWADVGLTPFEVAEKEAEEETGLHVRAVRLLALFDKKQHAHPPQPWYVYKCFVLCEVIGGELGNNNVETTGARWVREAELEALDLSTDRVTKSQMATMFEFARQPEKPTLCD
ncbi:NUDIX hydrolase N-terminal domain-containing protein [Hymenobacter sp. BT507]|uniref:NUDIX hydrolase N-terminal domain-containing protein n=1 Tax=Hymenobacter citatus TaxID=2763506 RepID=A0ABR7MGR5_9BACT|nr:NUDIX hydrolase N-terminal domain-containing protein [Hymenobacter citatus]MBC6609763.1 NUDIX hydrolase N-terminal domain-containing protein [Hymenobacter citatus]